MAEEKSQPPIDTDDDDLQILLPQELRKRWVVIPRYQLAQLLVVSAVLGISFGFGIVGWIYGIRWMYWSIPVGFTLLYAQNFALKSKDRKYTKEARKYNAPPPAP